MLISLIVLPGTGQRDVVVSEGTTVQQLVQQENLHGRQIIIDGITVPESEFSRLVTTGMEIAATSSVKGA